MRAGLVYLRPKQVVFVRTMGPYCSSSVEAWNVMLDWLNRNKLRSHVHCGFGLAQDHPSTVAPEQCRYDACVELPNDAIIAQNDGLAFQTLPGGAFARIRHVGPYSSVRDSIGLVRDQWLPQQAGLLADRRRPLLTIYLDDPTHRAKDARRCDVCVPVRTHHDEAFKRIKTVSASAA